MEISVADIFSEETSCVEMSELTSAGDISLLMTSEDPFMAVASKMSDASESAEVAPLVEARTAEVPIMNDSSNTLDTIDSSETVDGFTLLPPSPGFRDLPYLISTCVSPEHSSLSDLIKECKPCKIVLHKLSVEEINRYTSDVYQNKKHEPKKLYKSKRRIQKDSSVQDKFEQYKNYRQGFIQKKRNFTSDHGDFESSNEEYKPTDSYSKVKKRKRKKLTYEHDIDWSPNLENDTDIDPWKYTSTRNKKSDKLRISSRRRRIESDSDSESSEFDFFMYLEEDEKDASSAATEDKTVSSENIYDPSTVSNQPKKKSKNKVKKVEKPAESRQSTMIDNDVLSRIMQEMSDYNMKNTKGSKVVHSLFNGGAMKFPSSQNAKNNLSKGKRAGVKVTKDILPPSVTTVQKLLSNIVDTVVSIENKRVKEVEGSKVKKCKWCGDDFSSESKKQALCMPCKKLTNSEPLMGEKSKVKKSDLSGRKSSNTASPKSKIMNKVMKTFSKNDQQRLIYSDKASKSAIDKGYSHLKSFSPSSPQKSGNRKTVKGKKSENVKHKSPEKVKSKPGAKNSEKFNTPSSSVKQASPKSLKPKNVETNQSNVVMTNVDKGLFQITFPDPDKELSISLSETSNKNKVGGEQLPAKPTAVDASTYVMPTVPTVVVANYSSSKANNGDFVLRSVFYQNEVTRSTTVNSNTGISKALPTACQLSVIRPPSSAHSGSASKTNIRTTSSPLNSISLTKNIVISSPQTLLNKPPNMPNENCIQYFSNNANYNVEPDINRLISHCGLQITPAPSESNVSIRPIRMGLPQTTVPLANNLNYQRKPTLSQFISSCGIKITPATLENSLIRSAANNNLALSNNLIQNINTFSNNLGITPQSSIISPPFSNSVTITPQSSIISTPFSNSVAITPQSSIISPPFSNTVAITPQSSIIATPFSNSVAITPQITPQSPIISPPFSNSVVITPQIIPQSSIISSPFPNRMTIIPQSPMDPLQFPTHIETNQQPPVTPLQLPSSIEISSYSSLSNPQFLLNKPYSNEVVNPQDNNFTENDSIVNESYSNQNVNSENNSFAESNLIDNEVNQIQIEKSILTQNANVIGDSNNAKFEQVEKLASLKCDDESPLTKELQELEALSILSIIDLEKNPKATLLHKIDINNKTVEELSKDKTKLNEYKMALNTKEIFKIAKKWLTRFGSFIRLSEHFLKKEETETVTRPHIKKEYIEEEEEEMSSCQFTESSSQAVHQPVFADLSNSGQLSLNSFAINPLVDINHIANLETQVDSIADQLNSAGVDCTIPIPGITAMSSNNTSVMPNIPRADSIQDSRETPSRGSGPRTPARPESAASHVDERVLTPAMVKKERMETANSSPFSQCAYSGNNSVSSRPTTPATGSHTAMSNDHMSLGSQPSMVSPTMAQMLSQVNVSQHNLSPTVVPPGVGLNPMMHRPVSSTPNMSILPSLSYSNTVSNHTPNVSVRTVSQNIGSVQSANFMGAPRFAGPTVMVTNSSNYPSSSLQNSLSYQNQGPPNRTVSANSNHNLSKFFMDLASKPHNYNPNVSSSINANIVTVRSGQHGGQAYTQPQQPINQLYNVQQVYLPNKSPILQQTLNNQARATNQYIVRSSPNTAPCTLPGGTVLLNSASHSPSSLQQNNIYAIQNAIANFSPDPVAQTMNSANVQQVSSPTAQLSSSAAFLMQNNKVLLFEIKRPG